MTDPIDAGLISGPALAGFNRVRARADTDTTALASGDLDPALVLDVSAATVQVAALARVMRTEDETTRRLIDTTA